MFATIGFGAVTSRNRMVMAPMVTNFATPDNEVSDHQVTYYAERAIGGVGTNRGRGFRYSSRGARL